MEWLLKLYERAVAENADGDHILADLVHHFPLAICTRPGLGICFKNRGWYSRDIDVDAVNEPKKGGKIYNKILSNILRSLKVNEDARQQELALKILVACLELVAGCWPAVGLTLEPRLSSNWIANIAFFGLVISSFIIPHLWEQYSSTRSITALNHPRELPSFRRYQNAFLQRTAVYIPPCATLYSASISQVLDQALTCQPSHVISLICIYGGTISCSDKNLLSIFHLYEAEKLTPILSIFAKWSPSPDISISSQLDAVQNIDPIRMLRTCHVFPIWRRMSDGQEGEKVGLDEQVYDPSLLVAQMLAHHPPASSLEWVQTFRSNVFSLLVRCLSAKDAQIREASFGLLARVWKSVQLSDMQEKQHALYIFNLLKNLIKPSSDGPSLQLPSFASLILSHVLRGVFYPSNWDHDENEDGTWNIDSVLLSSGLTSM
ncbi:hypothetical protein BDR04DRAFT_237567 [Suillus decipiens]|nr:hypothetical protein BDR04DRAFT_237567 [Suillus decipiens]